MASAMIRNVQSFRCPDAGRPTAVCGKGKSANDTFKRIVLAAFSKNKSGALSYKCNPSQNEVEAPFCCPEKQNNVIGVGHIPSCRPAPKN
ncbi:hypothetical protein PCASD_10433 [Puccinia coronata f. sp. avenae]|uniref:Uncharacterized protein n=1 Tax=Puccinia coronata f. sp. avenae TaxID=200324 RepID=A0A2N5UEK9_9BASI|nr:hypothetical protein PCASD_10433 [Puccinia coronata f. sp. avenae]